MIKLGPITIMKSKTAAAYKEVYHDAAILHNELWFTDNWEGPMKVHLVNDNNSLGEALSYLPDPL